MESQESFSVSPLEGNQSKMSLLSLLFFMMGALNIYVYFQGTKSRIAMQFKAMIRFGLLVAGMAGMLGFYNSLILPLRLLAN